MRARGETWGNTREHFPKVNIFGAIFTVHVKARQSYKGRLKGTPGLNITIRFTESHVRKYLKPQIEKFLDEIDRQTTPKKRA
jgi:hypothetical protein